MSLRHVVASVGISGFLATWMLACSGPPTATDYNQTCKVDSDCVAVWSGSCDDTCQCPNAAINRGDEDKYDGDIQRSGCKIVTCTCSASGATCKSGTCTFAGSPGGTGSTGATGSTGGAT